MEDMITEQPEIGEVIGLEKASQEAIESLDSRDLLESIHMKKLSKMKDEAAKQEKELQKLAKYLVDSNEFVFSIIEDKVADTAEKAY
jgi:hypothetical protein